MAIDPLAKVRSEVGLRVAEIRQIAPRLSAVDLYSRIDAIRQLAAAHGLDALEGLARRSAQVALLPGSRIATAPASIASPTRSTATPRATARRSSPRSPSACTRHLAAFAH